MEVYFARDKDPRGGFLEVFVDMPDINVHRNTLQEVRKGYLPDGIEEGIFNAEITPDPETHYDKFFSPYFDKATIVWTKKGGFTDGSNTVSAG
jgi:hypothetical protein